MERIIAALPQVTDKDIESLGAGFGTALLSNSTINVAHLKLDELLAGSPDDAKQLVKSLLILDPAKRFTAKQALDHKYIEKYLIYIALKLLSTF